MVLDNAELLTNAECHDMIAELALRLPRGLPAGDRIATAGARARRRASARNDASSRSAETISRWMPRRRVHCSTVPVSQLSDVDVERLVARTEGWPAGLYLAALAMNAGSPHLAAASSFSGTDRFVAEYLRSEFLDRVSRADVLFLDPHLDPRPHVRFVVRRDGRANRVEPSPPTVGTAKPARHPDGSRQRVVPVPPPLPGAPPCGADAARTRDGPRASSPRPRRGTRRMVCRRQQSSMRNAPGTWSASARLVLTLANPVWASGRLDTVLRWMQWFADNELIEEQPAVAVHGALLLALVGNAADAERWADAAQHTTRTGTLSGREHDGRHARLPTDADLPRRPGGDATRRADRRSRDSARQVRIDPRCCTPKAPLISSAVTQTLRTAVSCRAVEEAGSTGATPFIPLLLAERGIARDRPGRLVVRRGARVTGTRDHAARVRQLLDECPALCLGCRVAAHRSDLNVGA